MRANRYEGLNAGMSVCIRSCGNEPCVLGIETRMYKNATKLREG